jgi:hypothetical protein
MNHHYILSHPYQPPHDEETYSQSSLCLGIACLAQSFDDSSGIRSPSDQCSLCNKLFYSLLAVTLKITHGSISDDEGLVSPVCCLAHSTLHTNLSGNTCNHHVGDAKTLKKIVELSLIEGPLPGLKIRYSPGSGNFIVSTASSHQLQRKSGSSPRVYLLSNRSDRSLLCDSRVWMMGIPRARAASNTFLAG